MNKRLYRSSRDKMISGVAAGIAEYFDIDPVITRAGFVILTLSGGVGILAYIILWIIVPYDYELNEIKTQEPVASSFEQNVPPEREANHSFTKNYLAASILIFIGLIMLIDNFVNISMRHVIPSILILIGIFILIRSNKKSQREVL